MITVEFPNGRKVRGIVLDEPVNGVSGIFECCFCDWRVALVETDTEGLAQEIETFANTHNCQGLTKERLLDAIARAKSGKPVIRRKA